MFCCCGNEFSAAFTPQCTCQAAATGGRHHHGETSGLPLVPSELTAVWSDSLAQFSRNRRLVSARRDWLRDWASPTPSKRGRDPSPSSASPGRRRQCTQSSTSTETFYASVVIVFVASFIVCAVFCSLVINKRSPCKAYQDICLSRTYLKSWVSTILHLLKKTKNKSKTW